MTVSLFDQVNFNRILKIPTITSREKHVAIKKNIERKTQNVIAWGTIVIPEGSAARTQKPH